MAMDAHLLFPIRSAGIVIRPGCSSPGIATDQAGRVQVALLGDKSFDISAVDLGSLKFAGAPAVSSVSKDVNADGIPDLLLTFDMEKLKLGPQATAARLTGWMKNSQAFFGEGKVRVVSSLATEDPSCR
jgi:hypothetical protein